MCWRQRRHRQQRRRVQMQMCLQGLNRVHALGLGLAPPLGRGRLRRPQPCHRCHCEVRLHPVAQQADGDQKSLKLMVICI